MTDYHQIEFKRKPNWPIEFWAYYDGSHNEALISAKGLLESLKYEEGYLNARAYVDGKAVRGEKNN